MKDESQIRDEKSVIRAEARRRRLAVTEPGQVSRQICERIAALSEFDTAGTVLFYVDRGSEVRTGTLIDEAFARNKTVVVPYCVGERLGLFRLETMAELCHGAYDILEPRPALRGLVERRMRPESLDLVVVPGVAFGIDCSRLGQGKGFYDRLLSEVAESAFLVAPAFECQMFEQIPTLPHDRPVDCVVTEARVYRKPIVPC